MIDSVNLVEKECFQINSLNLIGSYFKKSMQNEKMDSCFNNGFDH